MPLDSAGNTTPDYAGQVDQLSQGLAATQNAPQAAPPQYQAPPDPVTQTFFGKLLTGALQGLAGGVRSGMINEAGRGTPGFRPDASGADYAGMLQKQQNDQDLQNQAQARQAAQQKFTNDSETYRNQQAAVAQKAQAYQAQINALHTAQSMQYATADQQRAYLKGQQDTADHLAEQGVPVLGTFKDKPGVDATDALAQWMKQNNKQISDFTQTHSKGPNGEDIITVYDNPDHQVDPNQINSELKSMGSARRVTGSMSFGDKHALVMSEGAKLADQTYAKQAEDYKANLQLRNESALEGQRSSNAMRLEKLKESNVTSNVPTDAAGNPDLTKPLKDPVLEGNVQGLLNYKLAPHDIAGMGTNAAQQKKLIIASYLARNPGGPGVETLNNWAKEAQNVPTQRQLQNARDLFGSTSPNQDGAVVPGALPQLETALRAVPKSPIPMISRLRQHTSYELGSPEMAALRTQAGETASAYANFLGGGRSGTTDAQYKSAIDNLKTADTPEQVEAAIASMQALGASRFKGLVGINPFVAAQAKDIIVPGGPRDVHGPSQIPGASTNFQNQSGADQKIPPGMKLQRNKKTGETRVVPQ